MVLVGLTKRRPVFRFDVNAASRTQPTTREPRHWITSKKLSEVTVWSVKVAVAALKPEVLFTNFADALFRTW